MLFRVFLFLLVINNRLQLTEASSSSTCFWPNGSPAPKSTPCFPDQEASVCCEGTHACLSNKLCFDVEFNHVIRVSCTDSTWEDAACPDYCKTQSPSSLADVRQCPNQNQKWICGQNTTACEAAIDDGDTFTVPFGLVDDARSSTLSSVFIESATEITTTTSSTAATATSASTTSLETSSTTGPIAACTSGVGDGITIKSSSSSGKEAAVGAGIGVPLFLAFLTTLGLYLRERKLRKRALRGGDVLGTSLPFNDLAAAQYHHVKLKGSESEHPSGIHELDGRQRK